MTDAHDILELARARSKKMIAWIVGSAVALVGLVLAGLVLFTAWTARQGGTRLPPYGHFIDIDGARIHYLDEGTRPDASARSRPRRPDAQLHAFAARQAA